VLQALVIFYSAPECGYSCSTVLNPLLAYGYIDSYEAIKHPVPDSVKLSFVIFDIRALWRSAIAVPTRQHWASKG